MEYFYMFSEGEYSDYMVNGLYRSEVKLSEGEFKEYRSEMIERLVKDAGLGSDIIPELLKVYSEYTLRDVVYRRMFGEPPPGPYAAKQVQLNYSREEYLDSREEYLEWYQKKIDFFKDTELVFSTVDYLVGRGILTCVEYEEVHDIDG